MSQLRKTLAVAIYTDHRKSALREDDAVAAAPAAGIKQREIRTGGYDVHMAK